MTERDYIISLSRMLNESSSVSYYDAYMMQHQHEKRPELAESLIREFAEDVRRHRFNFRKCADPDGIVRTGDDGALNRVVDSIGFGYTWDRIRADVYMAIISRSAHPEKSVGVSRRKIEECLDIVCRNVNVLYANSSICVYWGDEDWPSTERLFRKYGLPAQMTEFYGGRKEMSYFSVCACYNRWAAYDYCYDEWVCNSDEGPAEIRPILEECPHDAPDIELIAALNRCLDVTHQRGDLASAFIEGGMHTLNVASNMKPDEIME